jgi:hypothetical protein
MTHFLLSWGIFCLFLGKSLVAGSLLSASFTGSACDSLRWLAQNAGFATLNAAFLRESSCFELRTAGLLRLVCIPDPGGMCYT